MIERYLKLRAKVLSEGTINLTDYELNEIVFLEEDIQEEIAEQRLMTILT